MEQYKDIHIGARIKHIAELKNLSISRACVFLNCSVLDIEQMYAQESLDSKILLKWCKLLDYNFFMFYHSHLQLYSPKSASTRISETIERKQSEDYYFRKNLYSPELIHWILCKWESGTLTAAQIIKQYHIPRTTLYRWKKKSKVDIKINAQLRHKKKVNYKRLYRDFLRDINALIPKYKRTVIIKELAKTNLGFTELNLINVLISESLGSTLKDSKMYQQLKTYDRPFIHKILHEQGAYGLSDYQLSSMYKVSRNTLAKWKKMFGS